MRSQECEVLYFLMVRKYQGKDVLVRLLRNMKCENVLDMPKDEYEVICQ
jgi:hypothetical protein